MVHRPIATLRTFIATSKLETRNCYFPNGVVAGFTGTSIPLRMK